MPAVVVCNHVSYIDILYFIASSCPIAFVSKDGVRKVPLVGTFAQTYTSLFVDRSDVERHVRTKSYDDSSLGDASSRSASFHGSVNESVKDAIRERIETVEGVSDELGRYVPRIVIFPEGTTTNNKYLLKFKRGAFQPLKPVQPVLLRYSFSNFDPSYLRTTFGHLLAMMCQLYNSLSVEWMEPMKPSRTVDLFASPADRMLAVDQFADEVCSAMAARLRVPVSDATVLEKRDFMINIFWPSKGKGNGLAAAVDENDKTE
jgi:lysophosphatidylcholine acyltransferase/lyso-PAF acetyltransferase